MASITNSTITFSAQHNKYSQKAIESVADALKANAQALEVLAQSIKVDIRDTCAIKIVGDGE